MSNPELVVVRTFGDHFAADVAKTALDAAGIECFVRSDDAGGEYPGLSLGRGAQPIVRTEDAKRADEILVLEPRRFLDCQVHPSEICRKGELSTGEPGCRRPITSLP